MRGSATAATASRRGAPACAALSALPACAALSALLPGAALSALLAAGLLPGRLAAQGFPMDTAGLGAGPYASMHVLVEKSIFKVNVLTLDLRVDSATAARLRQLAGGREYSDALADTLSRTAFEATDAWALVRFHRGFSLDRMLKGIRRNLRGSVDEGMIGAAAYDSISRRLPDWLGFLRRRGVREGDTLRFRLRGDSVSVFYRATGGETLADASEVNRLRRISVLGRYLAPGSDFRTGLVRSLFGDGG